MTRPEGHGVLAGFADTEALVSAVHRLRAQGYVPEVYTPYPVDGLTEALGVPRSRLPLAMLVGGLLGAIGTLWLQWYSAVVDYPIDVGGRPAASWPAFIPSALEMTVLGAAVFGMVALLVGCGLPKLHHPLFNVERFERASRDGLFVLLRNDDPHFDALQARADLDAVHALQIDEVPA